MRFSLRGRLSRSLLPVALASLSLGCMGRANLLGSDGSSGDGGSGSSSGGSSGSSSGASSSSGSGGSSGSSSGGSPDPAAAGRRAAARAAEGSSNPDCSLLELPDLARVCPDGTSVGGQYVLSNHECVLEFLCPPPTGSCSQGSTCSPGSSCGPAIPAGSVGSNCDNTSCTCDSTGHFQCSVGSCPPPPPPVTSCTQGASCSPGSGCGSIGTGSDCTTSCTCDPNGFFECVTSCEDASPPPITDPCPGYPVPDICEVCPNGVTECAHAILVNGECETENLPERVAPSAVLVRHAPEKETARTPETPGSERELVGQRGRVGELPEAGRAR